MKKNRLPSTTALMAFESAARHLNFGRAGQELHVTQGAISQQVRQLEEMLGVALFARVRQRVVLTNAGERYLSEVRRILNDLGEITNQAMASGDNEILNLAVVPTFAIKWLVPNLKTFFQANPGINLNLVSRNAPFDFSVQSFDAAIHYGEPSWSGAVCTHLMNEDMLPVCSAVYQQSMKLQTSSDLARAVLLQQFTRPSAWRDWFACMGIEYEGAFQGPRFDSFLMILEAVHANLGAALLPRFLVQESLEQGRLVLLSDQVLPSSRGYYLVCPEAKQHRHNIAVLREWLVAKMHNY